MELVHRGDSQDYLDSLQADNWGIHFDIIKAWLLCTTFGDKPHFVFEKLSFLVPFLGKYKLVCYGYNAGWFVNKSPSPYPVELVKLGMYGTFLFRPVWRCFRFSKAMAFIIRDYSKCFLSHYHNSGFFFIWEWII